MATAPISIVGRARVRRDGPTRTPCPKRSESWEEGETPWRGGSGPLGTQWSRYNDPLLNAWQKAGQQAGWPITRDVNGADPVGFSGGQLTIRNGRRASAAAAYLKPVLKRPNLSVRTNAHVTGIVLRGTHTTGVNYIHRGTAIRAEAAREVLLCGGTFNSPQLLMLSGIGPAADLKQIGIAPLVDLPVGRNLRDHLQIRLSVCPGGS